ncbi:hypothetical protein SLE2022_343420 [Rubroshorea leprosula]
MIAQGNLTVLISPTEEAIAVTDPSWARNLCTINLVGFCSFCASTSWKIGTKAMVPSSPPEIRSEPSLFTLRQETGLLCAEYDWSNSPEGIRSV